MTANQVLDDGELGDYAGVRHRAVVGVRWQMTSRMTMLALQFGIGIALARLLPPEDFGLLALAMIAVGFASLLSGLGLGAALVQRDRLTEAHVRTAFTLSVTVGVLLAASVYAAAPQLAQVLGDSRTEPLLRLLSSVLAIGGLSAVAEALLSRQLAFRQLFLVDAARVLVGGCVAVSLALMGYGVWSLAVAAVAERVVTVAVTYGLAPFPVGMSMSRRALRDLAPFATGISLTGLFNYVALKGDYFVIGRILGAGPLGVYGRAYSLMEMPTIGPISGLTKVMFPAAARLQSSSADFRRAYVGTLSIVHLLTAPLFAFLLVLAPELIQGLYGPSWSGAIVPLQILAVVGLFRASYAGAAAFVRARGWAWRLLACQIGYSICIVGGAWIATPAGIAAVAFAVGCAIVAMWLSVTWLGARAAGVGLGETAVTFGPGLVFGLSVAAAAGVAKLAATSAGAAPLMVLAWAALAAVVAAVAAVRFVPPRLLGHLPQRVRRMIMEASNAGSEERLDARVEFADRASAPDPGGLGR